MTCPTSCELVSELPDPESFGPLSLVRRKKRLCHKSKLSHLLRYVTISALTKKHFALKSGELLVRAIACIETKRVIMVRTFIKQKTEVDGDVTMEGPELPDYTADEGDQPDQANKEDEEWCMADYDEVEISLREIIKKEGIHPVDTTTIAAKSNPIPLKDVKKNWLTAMSEGYYCGHNSIREFLEKDTFDALIGGRIRKVSRWALNPVNPDLRIQANLVKAELQAQFVKNH